METSTSTEILDAALALAARGWHVVPLAPHGKNPISTHGVLDATTDPDRIRKWWARTPDANVGIACGARSGIVILDVDVDPEKGIDGEAALAALVKVHGPLPETVEVKTPRGGRHIYFQHYPMKMRSDIAPGIEIKSDGRCVVAPPSVRQDGRRYAWELSSHVDDLPIAEMPVWLLQLAVKPVGPGPAPPMPEVIAEGQRNVTLTSLGGSMRRRGASEVSILAALRAENAERCRPPLPEEEVAAIASSLGRYAPEPEPPANEGDGGDVQVGTADPAPRTGLRVLHASDLINMPDPKCLIEGLLVENSFSVIAGLPGSAKSFLALDWALCMACGMEHWNGKTILTGPALYVAGEGSSGMGKRIRAWLATHEGMEPGDQLVVVPEAINLMEEKEVNRLMDVAQPLKPVLIVLDTLSRCMSGGDENAPRDMTAFINGCDKLRATGAAVLVIHHLDKKAKDARGHSSLRGACDTMLRCTAQGTDKGSRIIQVSCEKQKDMEPSGALFLTIQGVDGTGSCVLRFKDTLGVSDDSNAFAVLKALVDNFGTYDTPTNIGGNSVQNSPRTNLDHPPHPVSASTSDWLAVSKVGRSGFYACKKRLVEDGFVEQMGAGPRFRWMPTERGEALVRGKVR